MKYLPLVLGQVTLVLSLVLVSRIKFDLPSWQQFPSLRRGMRSTLDTLRLLLTLVATLHICIFISHKLLLRYFGITFSPQVWQHVDTATIELALRSRPVATIVVTLGILALPALYMALSQKLALMLSDYGGFVKKRRSKACVIAHWGSSPQTPACRG